MSNRVFGAADVLLPRVNEMEKWAVVACDQFSSEPEYWARVRREAEGAPSALNLILPEAELGAQDEQERIVQIHAAMRAYLAQGVFEKHERAFVYVERTLVGGAVRRGVVGMVDLERYDYRAGAQAAVRATEKTVVERIPPRMAIRQGAAVELPHVLLLCDDERRALIEPLTLKKDSLPLLYDFELMEHGGRIAGYLVQGGEARALEARIDDYEARCMESSGLCYAVGDGNHSLAAAKACYEAQKAAQDGAQDNPARFALVELENIRDDAQVFEPIHRIVTGVEPEALLSALEERCGAAQGHRVAWIAGERRGSVTLSAGISPLAVGVLQGFLDEYLAVHGGQIDYIHGEDVLERLAQRPDAVGFLLPPMEKGQLFDGVVKDGSLPRKTFSMGHACEKRYYLEARRIAP